MKGGVWGRPGVASVLAALLVVCGTGVGSEYAGTRDLPEYPAAYTTRPPVVDGDLGDPSWHSTVMVELRDNLSGEPGRPRTTARLLWDDRFLYVAFACADPEPFATLRERDAHLWTEEVVEVFLQPVEDPPHYIEVEVNPLGTLLDIYLIDVRKPIPYASWNPPDIRWAVQTGRVDGASGWTCEMAVPLAEAVTAPAIPPRPGDRWRMNLYRLERRPERAALAWSPTFLPDFHVPQRFGVLVFQRED